MSVYQYMYIILSSSSVKDTSINPINIWRCVFLTRMLSWELPLSLSTLTLWRTFLMWRWWTVPCRRACAWLLHWWDSSSNPAECLHHLSSALNCSEDKSHTPLDTQSLDGSDFASCTTGVIQEHYSSLIYTQAWGS